MRVLIPLFAIFLLFSQTTFGQVTTSSMRGRVSDNKEGLMAATVKAVHTPSGTKYFSQTDAQGNFFINNMRVGGPYEVEISYVGFAKFIAKGIQLKLGETYYLKAQMSEESSSLKEVVVTAGKGSVFSSARTGAMTHVGLRELKTLPTISRSITDFTKLTPQASGNSFGGRDGRFNNITIDGGSFNNNFGLGGNNLPGGSAQPISLDAIDQVSVNIAPYDVRLSRFTGASINATTKSGDNDFRGSAYTYLRPKSFTGEKIGDLIVKNAREKEEQTYGFTFSGPIIKDKLFFFVNGEMEQKTSPYSGWFPNMENSGQANIDNKISRTNVEDLEKIHQYLLDTYNYEAGKYKDFAPLTNKNYKFLVKLDWNINANHKLALRYNYLNNRSQSLINATSAPSGLRRANSGRISEKSIAFSNSFFGNKNTVHGFSGELNSRIGDDMTNKFLVTYTGTINPERTSTSAPFPMVDIYKDKEPYISFGYELFSYRNKVINNNFSISNDFTKNFGEHTLLVGLGYENIYVYNSYIREGTSYYRYSSIDDFMNQAKPIGFGITYGYGGKEPNGAQLSFGLASAYAQDDWMVTPTLKLSMGLRLEMPLYHSKLATNPAIDALPAFEDGFKLDLSSWPKSQLMVNPRIGFNWDVTGDRKIQLRGGTGLFTGVIPFVWFTNQPTNSGILQSPEIGLGEKAIPDGFKFNPNWKEQVANYPNLFPNEPAKKTHRAYNVAQVAKDFRMPQIWRSNLAVDFALPYKTTLTLEGIFSKDIYGIMQRNYNYPKIDNNQRMADGRAYYKSNTVRQDIGSVIVLGNTNKGYQAFLTAQLKKEFDFGLNAMVAYTYSNARDISENPGDAAYSAWSNNLYVDNIDEQRLSYSKFAQPHRVIGSLSYRVDYLKHFATTVSLFYTGAHQGRASFIFNRDVNGDKLSKDLVYIPTTQELKEGVKLPLVDIKDKKGNVTFSASEQQEALENFLANDPYAKKHRGQFAERFGILEPWSNRFDLKVLQDIYSTFGTDRRYTLQLSLDVINVGNLLNSSWGTYQRYGLPNAYGNISLLTTDQKHKPEAPRYQLNASTAEKFKELSKWAPDLNVRSTWGMLFGARLIF